MEISNKSEIFHLQSLFSSEHNRKGVIIRRRDGEVEFREDRQPNGPSVIYKHSLLSTPSATSGRSVVDLPRQSCVAAFVGEKGTILLWELQRVNW